LRVSNLIAIGCVVGGFAGASAAVAAGDPPTGSPSSSSPPPSNTSPQPAPANSGGTGFDPGPPPPSTPAHPVAPGSLAKIIHGVAYAPSYAPIQVQRAIWAGNRIRQKPYLYGGGHGKWNDAGYDCSGSVSYVLHAAGLIRTSMSSADFMSWGQATGGQVGAGQWITVYANSGHAFVEIAGIRLDTSAEGDRHPARASGPRWRRVMASTAGYIPLHPLNY
jgi:hypothetical protein